MKTKISLFATTLVFACCIGIYPFVATAADDTDPQGPCIVFASPEVYPLAQKWAIEYSGMNPDRKIQLVKAEDSGLESLAKEPGQIGFVTDRGIKELSTDPSWQIVVGREIIVPVCNASNPFMQVLSKQGITSKALKASILKPGDNTWGTLLKTPESAKINYYVLNDPATRAHMGKFLDADDKIFDVMPSLSREDILAALKTDRYAVAFCRLNDILTENGQNLAENVKLLPLDKNGNGKLDYMEQIYDNPQAFSRGVWIGKYPHTLISNIYVISASQPDNQTAEAFLSWVLTDGQQYLSSAGYSTLEMNESQSHLDKVNPAEVVTPTVGANTSTLEYILYGLGILVVLGLVMDRIIRYVRKKQDAKGVSSFKSAGSFHRDGVRIPAGLFFDKTHTWAFMEKDGTVRIGIDDFLNHVTGPVSRVEMKNPGDRISKGDPFITIVQQGRKLVLYAPVSGIIKAHNRCLTTRAATLHESPFAEGWVYQVEPVNWRREIEFLSMADKYANWLKTEFDRLKDFLSISLAASRPELAHVVLQDGGALKEGLLADLDPAIWEEFQNKFLDTGK